MLKELYSLFVFLYGTIMYYMYTGDKQALKDMKQIIKTASKNPEFKWSIEEETD